MPEPSLSKTRRYSIRYITASQHLGTLDNTLALCSGEWLVDISNSKITKKKHKDVKDLALSWPGKEAGLQHKLKQAGGGAPSPSAEDMCVRPLRFSTSSALLSE